MCVVSTRKQWLLVLRKRESRRWLKSTNDCVPSHFACPEVSDFTLQIPHL